MKRPWLTVPLLSLLAAAEASEIVGWRGDGTGYFPQATLPAGKVAFELAWSAQMPNPSTGSPVVAGDKVFVRSDPDLLICLDRAHGKELWRAHTDIFEHPDFAKHRDEGRKRLDRSWRLRPAAMGNAPKGQNFDKPEDKTALEQAKADMKWLSALGIKPSKWPEEGFSSMTPVADQDLVVVKSGTGALHAFSHDGTRRWAAIYQPPNPANSGESQESMLNSPLLDESRVYCLYNPPQQITGSPSHHVESVVAFDRKSGAEIWRCATWFRTPGWLCASPVLAMVGSDQVVVTPGGGVVRCRDGKELARDVIFAGSANTPVARGDLVWCLDMESHGMNKKPENVNKPGVRLQAVRLVPDGANKARAEELWTVNPGDTYRMFPSIMLHGEHIFLKCGNGKAMVFAAATGDKLLESKPLLKHAGYPSPVSGGKAQIWVDGSSALLALSLDPAAKVLGEWTPPPELKGYCTASPALDGDLVFIRNQKALIAVRAR